MKFGSEFDWPVQDSFWEGSRIVQLDDLPEQHGVRDLVMLVLGADCVQGSREQIADAFFLLISHVSVVPEQGGFRWGSVRFLVREA